MKALGFPFCDAKHLLLRSESRNKKARREKITGKYEILLFLGDNMNDFPGDYFGKTNRERKTLVDSDWGSFGTKYFVLPNPSYGVWVDNLTGNKPGLTHGQQSRLRKNGLRKWSGD